ncbi:MAG: hypothetical protein AAF429_03805 [Pseudomonadota bacterium]
MTGFPVTVVLNENGLEFKPAQVCGLTLVYGTNLFFGTAPGIAAKLPGCAPDRPQGRAHL